MLNVEIARRVSPPVSDAFVRRAVAAVFPRERRRGVLSVAFVGSARMRVLNRLYHGEDRVTDVLAFGQPEADSRKPMAGDRNELGELIICPTYIRQQAKRAGEPFRREIARVLIHGTLHLLGHDHATPKDAERMFGRQEQMVQKISNF